MKRYIGSLMLAFSCAGLAYEQLNPQKPYDRGEVLSQVLVGKQNRVVKTKNLLELIDPNRIEAERVMVETTDSLLPRIKTQEEELAMGEFVIQVDYGRYVKNRRLKRDEGAGTRLVRRAQRRDDPPYQEGVASDDVRRACARLAQAGIAFELTATDHGEGRSYWREDGLRICASREKYAELMEILGADLIGNRRQDRTVTERLVDRFVSPIETVRLGAQEITDLAALVHPLRIEKNRVGIETIDLEYPRIETPHGLLNSETFWCVIDYGCYFVDETARHLVPPNRDLFKREQDANDPPCQFGIPQEVVRRACAEMDRLGMTYRLGSYDFGKGRGVWREDSIFIYAEQNDYEELMQIIRQYFFTDPTKRRLVFISPVSVFQEL